MNFQIAFSYFLFLPALSFAQVVSVNFEGLESNAGVANLIGSTETAGFVPAENWVNLSGATGVISNLPDASETVTTIGIEWRGQAQWSWERSGDAVPAGPNGALFNGYLDTTGNDGSHTIEVTAVPYAVYDVIVYVDGEHTGSERSARININPGSVGDNPDTNRWTAEGGNWMGDFVEATAEGAPGTANANYVRFRGISGVNFSLYAEAENFRAAINGFQIVEITDEDGDGLPAEWEIANMLDDQDDGSINPEFGPDGDPDEDGSTNFEEFSRSPDPRDNDSDDDFLLDGVETNDRSFVDEDATGTDPLASDTDSDGLEDGAEVTGEFPSDPNLADTDGEGIRDGDEIRLGIDPMKADSDEDGADDTLEIALGTDPLAAGSKPSPDVEVIGVNFAGLDDPNGNTDYPNLLNPTDEAGLISSMNWNNAQAVTGMIADLTEHGGSPTGASVTWTGQAVWSWERSNRAVPEGGTGTLLNGYLDTIGNDGFHTIEIAGIPYENYDLLVYLDGENTGAGRPLSLALDVTEQEIFISDTENWSGVFSQGFGENLATATSGANFVAFNDLTASALTLTATARNFRAGVNGFQIIGGLAKPLEITNFIYDRPAGTVNLSWNSVTGVSYAIETSTDLQGPWLEADDHLATDSISSVTLIGLSEEVETLFFRIRMQN
ncbi:MAG: hypothetical protein ACON4K_01600 [Akkermansiaceae bacterium]